MAAATVPRNRPKGVDPAGGSAHPVGRRRTRRRPAGRRRPPPRAGTRRGVGRTWSRRRARRPRDMHERWAAEFAGPRGVKVRGREPGCQRARLIPAHSQHPPSRNNVTVRNNGGLNDMNEPDIPVRRGSATIALNRGTSREPRSGLDRPCVYRRARGPRRGRRPPDGSSNRPRPALPVRRRRSPSAPPAVRAPPVTAARSAATWRRPTGARTSIAGRRATTSGGCTTRTPGLIAFSGWRPGLGLRGDRTQAGRRRKTPQCLGRRPLSRLSREPDPRPSCRPTNRFMPKASVARPVTGTRQATSTTTSAGSRGRSITPSSSRRDDRTLRPGRPGRDVRRAVTSGPPAGT